MGTPKRIRQLRIVVEAEDYDKEATIASAELVAEPTVTPWRSLNSRLNGPAGLQITLFQELDAQN